LWVSRAVEFVGLVEAGLCAGLSHWVCAGKRLKVGMNVLLLGCCRDPESVARSVAAAQEQLEASRAGRNKSFIPLSKAGIQLGSSKQVKWNGC